jgi:M6 family metalloprotease-like protein
MVLTAIVVNARGIQPEANDSDTAQLTGTLSVIWGDPVGESTVAPYHSIWLEDDLNKTWELIVEEDTLRAAGGILALNNTIVMVKGRAARADRPAFAVETITQTKDALRDPIAREISGSQPFIWLFFKFADNPNPTAESFDWFEEQALGGYSMDDFYRELSYNTANMAGSMIFRWWFTLPRIPADYGIIGDTENGDVNLDLLLWDALNLTLPVIDFRPYEGMVLVFNGPLDCCAWGGRPSLALSGEPSRPFGVVWIGDGGFQGHDVITHELGHAFGLPHSSGCGVEYESIWDLMGLGCGTCTQPDPRTNTPHGVHAIAYHKDRLGWIHPLHQYTLPASAAGAVAARIWLHDLARVPPQGQFLWARALVYPLVPTYYTVERRCLTGYDANLPDAVVAIHYVNETRSIPADMIDVDGGECNDEGSMWRPGESFHDAGNDVLISVEWANDSSSIVTLTNEPRAGAYVNWSSSTCEDGSTACPWNTVSEGHSAVLPHGGVHIAPGVYPETLIMGKPAMLTTNGPGSVTIGQ